MKHWSSGITCEGPNADRTIAMCGRDLHRNMCVKDLASVDRRKESTCPACGRLYQDLQDRRNGRRRW